MSDLADLSYPRLKARTRGFQLGRPRAFAVAGGLVLFIRGDGPTQASGDLWSIDAETGEEHLVVHAADLQADDAELPAAERARRERMREVAEGITAFSIDEAATAVTFVVAGTGYVHDLVTGETTRIPVDEPVVDPRIAPDGSAVSFVVGTSLWLWDRAGDARALCAPEPGEDDVAWGLADFAAAEELDRYRGHWWLPDSSALLVERVDESGVVVAWISDPEHPRNEPRPHRYPFAGTDNADVSLWLVDRDGKRQQLDLPNGFPYLATVSPSRNGTVVSVLTRDQEAQRVLRLDDAALVQVDERRDDAWVDVVPGVPVLTGDGVLVDVVADTAADTYRLTVDGTPLTPVGLQVAALLHQSDDAFVVLAQPDPRALVVYRVDRASGEVTALTSETAWSAAVAGDHALVVVTADARSLSARAEVRLGDGDDARVVEIASNAATPNLDVRPQFVTVGERGLQVAVLWPRDHVPGTKLPVVCSPYGGPHHSRVVYAAGAYATDQWLADQGFAVVITDNRGTPGRGPAWDRAVKYDLAGPVLDDQVDALLALGAELPDLDLTRVGMRGWSFGGFLSAMAVIDRPDVFHAAVAGAPVADFAMYDTAYTERYLGLPQEHPEAYTRSDLTARAGTLSRPMLILHGLADDNVLVTHALSLSSALLAAGRPHAFVPLSGVTHMTPQEVVAENLLRLEVDFFRSNLGA